MKLLMVTNTYLPMVGGVSQSVSRFTEAYRARGHEVLVIAPTFEGADSNEPGVVRVPAIQNVNGSDFSVRLPIPGLLARELDRFHPQLVHSHHPFLLGDTALRIAAGRGLPLVFTHHTMYERYTHYVPGDSPAMQRMAVSLATHYANLAQQVIAPSESIAQVLRERGVETPIEPIPTGVDCAAFAKGDGIGMRRALEIPDDASVVGHVGRLAPEKNLDALADAVSTALADRPKALFLVVGEGPSAEGIERLFAHRGLNPQLRMAGKRTGEDLVNCYHAMDLFAFASQSETQGMVLAEAMASGVPVCAVDAPGVREIVEDGRNGRLVFGDSTVELAQAIGDLIDLESERRKAMAGRARRTAERFDTQRCADRALALYHRIRADADEPTEGSLPPWERLLARVEAEWNLWRSRLEAAIDSLSETGSPEDNRPPCPRRR